MSVLILIAVMSYIQNITFSLVSRSRNRDSFYYHAAAATLSNGVWYLTMQQLVLTDMDMKMFLPYLIGTVAGSLTGQKVSMWIEGKIGASA